MGEPTLNSKTQYTTLVSYFTLLFGSNVRQHTTYNHPGIFRPRDAFNLIVRRRMGYTRADRPRCSVSFFFSFTIIGKKENDVGSFVFLFRLTTELRPSTRCAICDMCMAFLSRYHRMYNDIKGDRFFFVHLIQTQKKGVKKNPG